MEERQLRFEEIGVTELVERAQLAQVAWQPKSEPARRGRSSTATAEQIRQAVAAAESRLVRRALEAARLTQQRRVFASLGRR